MDLARPKKTEIVLELIAAIPMRDLIYLKPLIAPHPSTLSISQVGGAQATALTKLKRQASHAKVASAMRPYAPKVLRPQSNARLRN